MRTSGWALTHPHSTRLKNWETPHCEQPHLPTSALRTGGDRTAARRTDAVRSFRVRTSGEKQMWGVPPSGEGTSARRAWTSRPCGVRTSARVSERPRKLARDTDVRKAEAANPNERHADDRIVGTCGARMAGVGRTGARKSGERRQGVRRHGERACGVRTSGRSEGVVCRGAERPRQESKLLSTNGWPHSRHCSGSSAHPHPRCCLSHPRCGCLLRVPTFAPRPSGTSAEAVSA